MRLCRRISYRAMPDRTDPASVRFLGLAVGRSRIQIEYACIHSEYAPAGRQPLTRWRRELDWLKGNGVT